jgi:hypothetical protein
MDSQQILYGMNLDDYWYPDLIRNKRGYVGTQEDFETFAELLSTFCQANEECYAVSTSIRRHFDGTSAQNVSEEHRDPYEGILSLEVVCESEEVILENHFWQHIVANDAVYPMYAERVYVKRIVVMHSGILYTAIKGAMVGLRVCIQGTGWIPMNGNMSGYPEMVAYDPEEDIYEMRMFAVDGRIRPGEKDEVIQHWAKGEELDLDYLCRDIIAEGKVLWAHLKESRR